MAEKNHYEILGVDRKASEDDIKKAFRKLVRQYHPDVSKAADADTRMSEINAAYDVLRDPQKRSEYDQMLDNPFVGAGPAGGGRYGSAGGYDFDPSQFAQFGGAGFDFSDLFGQFRSGNRAQGGHPSWGGQDQHARLTIDLQTAYEGGERLLSVRVPVADAQGRIHEQLRQLQVKIPQGIRAGQQIRLAGQGMAGVNGGAAGDLYLEVQFADDPRYRIEGADVYQTLAVYPWEAALGHRLAVATPAGRLEVKIPAGSQSGQTLRLKGKGIPARTAGDLYLRLDLRMPPDLADSQTLWQALADHYAPQPLSR